MKYFKKPILVFLAVVLTAIALASVPTVDNIELRNSSQYPFFYASTLPPIYYIATAYLVVLAVFGGDRRIKLLSVVLVALLVEFTPSTMLTNPLLPDQYPYLSEAVWLVKEGHIAHIHYLDQVPGLGLMFSQLMLTTGLGPFEVSDIYPCIAVLAFALPLFLLSEKSCGNGALVPLLFLSSNFVQINVFNRSSQFLMLFAILTFLLIMRAAQVEGGRRVGSYSILCVLAFLTAVITYPGSIILVTTVLVALVLTLFLNVEGVGKKYFPVILVVIFFAVFLTWNMYIGRWEFSRMVRNVYGAIQELTIPEIPITSGKPEITGLTSVFEMIIQARIAITMLVFSLAGIYTLYTLLARRRTPRPYALLFFGVATSVAPFIATGWSQWFVLKFAPYMLILAAPCVAAFVGHCTYKRVPLFVVFAIILAGLMVLPILRYSSIPYLHTTTKEYCAIKFVHTHHNELEPIYYVEYPPYMLPRLQLGKDLSWDVTATWPEELETAHTNFLTSERLLTRDGYYIHYMGSYKKYLETLIFELETTHNVVFASGDHVKLFLDAP